MRVDHQLLIFEALAPPLRSGAVAGGWSHRTAAGGERLRRRAAGGARC